MDYLGSLFKVDAALNETIKTHEQGRRPGVQLPLGETATPTKQRDSDRVRLALVEKLEHFLGRHTRSEDLGLRLDGEQLAAGVRFVRMSSQKSRARRCCGKPSVYHSQHRCLDSRKPFVALYPEARADLCAAFYIRALELTRPGGRCGLPSRSVTGCFLARLKCFSGCCTEGIRLIADFGKGAFSQGSQLITTSACLMSPGHHTA